MKLTRTLLLISSSAILGLALTGAVLGGSPRSSNYKYLSNFADTLEIIESAYVEPRSPDDVMGGAFMGLLESLDPESAYLSTEDTMFLKAPSSDTDGWLGLTVSKRQGYAIVVSVAAASPAAAAEIETGQIIRQIDGETTRRMNVVTIRRLLSGKIGSAVKLKLLSEENPTGTDITLERVQRLDPQMEVRPLSPDSLYVKLPQLTSSTAQQLQDTLSSHAAASIVLDLRSAAEGRLVDGFKVADLFLGDTVMAKVRGRSREADLRRELAGVTLKLAPKLVPPPETRPAKSEDPPGEADIANDAEVEKPHDGYEFEVRSTVNPSDRAERVVVLIDRGTAGAAELIAGALANGGRAQIIGKRTFGSASLQDVLESAEGVRLRLTVATFWTPEGQRIFGRGIQPTEELEDNLSSESRDDAETGAIGPDSMEDPALQRAIEILETDEPQKKAA